MSINCSQPSQKCVIIYYLLLSIKFWHQMTHFHQFSFETQSKRERQTALVNGLPRRSLCYYYP